MTPSWSAEADAQALYHRLWGSGFLPTQAPGRHAPLAAATRCCTSRTPPASTPQTRRRMLDALGRAQPAARSTRSATRRSQHAHRPVRDGLPHADVGARADRPLRGAEAHPRHCTAPTCAKPGTFAANCLLARRLAERGVRFVQLFHRGWDQHGNLARRPAAAVPATSTRPCCGADHRPEAARPAGRHAGRSGAANSAARSTARGR